MPERYHPGVQGPNFKDRFVYDATTDSYLCPQGQRLPCRGLRRNNVKMPGPFLRMLLLGCSSTVMLSSQPSLITQQRRMPKR